MLDEKDVDIYLKSAHKDIKLPDMERHDDFYNLTEILADRGIIDPKYDAEDMGNGCYDWQTPKPGPDGFLMMVVVYEADDRDAVAVEFSGCLKEHRDPNCRYVPLYLDVDSWDNVRVVPTPQ